MLLLPAPGRKETRHGTFPLYRFTIFLRLCATLTGNIRVTRAEIADLLRLPIQNKVETSESCASALLTEATELADDVGQGDVGHTLQLVLDVPRQHRVAQVPGLNGALHQRHPFAATPLPAVSRGENMKIKMVRSCHRFNHTNNNHLKRFQLRLCKNEAVQSCGSQVLLLSNWLDSDAISPN